MQAEARAFMDAHNVETVLARIGDVTIIGSFRTSLMVWRDLDFSVDAPGSASADVFRAMLPLLERSTALRYEDDEPNGRFYYVVDLGGWKLDVSVWRNGVPDGLEAFHDELASRLRDDRELRPLLLRLKDAWYADPNHDRTVGYEIYRAVLDHGVRTVDELAAYLS